MTVAVTARMISIVVSATCPIEEVSNWGPDAKSPTRLIVRLWIMHHSHGFDHRLHLFRALGRNLIHQWDWLGFLGLNINLGGNVTVDDLLFTINEKDLRIRFT